jgi:hypothetical protein
MMITPSLAVADTGATSFFLTKDAPCQNKRQATNLITITLPDGLKIVPTHICDITIPGLPTVLTGHIMPDMTTASFFGIRVLCKVGCTVTFDEDKCQVLHNGSIILTGYKDPVGNLWRLPVLPVGAPRTTPNATHQSSLNHCLVMPRNTPQIFLTIARQKKIT